MSSFLQQFLSSLNPPLEIADEKIVRWHPAFQLDTVPDIEEAELPKPPITGQQPLCDDLQMKPAYISRQQPNIDKSLNSDCPTIPISLGQSRFLMGVACPYSTYDYPEVGQSAQLVLLSSLHRVLHYCTGRPEYSTRKAGPEGSAGLGGRGQKFHTRTSRGGGGERELYQQSDKPSS